jgi:PadR family transcriptional regulator PadR
MPDAVRALLPGTLDLLVLKALSLGETHGYGVLLRIQEMTGGALAVEQGTVYPALYRLERQGLLQTEWGVSDNNRRARFYRLTTPGRTRLREQIADWQCIATAIGAALSTKASDL